MNFADFKKQQNKLKDSVTKLAQSPTNNYSDDRFWKLEKDAQGDASAVIRFLPQQDTSKAPIILQFKHQFKINNKWFFEECPVTIKEKCPVCEMAAENWERDPDCRKFWRTKSYVGNILVVSDSLHPENEGKIFLFRFGKSVYDILIEAISPEDADEEGINIFDFDEGINFKIKIFQKGGYNNYTKSKFAAKTSEIEEDDQEDVFNSILALDEFSDPKLYKTYEEVQSKFMKSLGAGAVPSIQEELDKSQKKSEETDDKEPVTEDKTDENSDDSDEFDFNTLLSDDDDIPF